MKIVLVHNYYRQSGGEDAVFAAEAALLRQKGHEVVQFTEDNRRINGIGQIAVAAHTIWSRPTRHRLLRVLRDVRCDVAHFHNTFPLISPAAYSACREAGVPVVQTLHNYRLLCSAATFFRDGGVCEDCFGKTPPWPGVLHACYRESRAQTTVVAAMLTLHRWFKTWQEQVDIYVALTEFARRKFIEGGLPAEKILVKPNFVSPDLGMRESEGSYALFVGRMAPEKGVRVLLQAWQGLQGAPLKIVGDGPLRDEVRAFVQEQKLECIAILGQCARQEVLTLMKGAQFLVFPSGWYEGFPITIAEAFACGVPVVASRLGAMAEIIEEGCTGLFFTSGDADDLSAQVQWAFTHPEEMAQMGRRARQEFQAKYTADRNYERLMAIYRKALGPR
jgi:glycosyltransferase involved in cell wall biosynthesis